VASPDQPAIPGVAKALLILTVAQYRAARDKKPTNEPVGLWALNNKVKGIYDRYYFRVVIKDALVERPPRGKKTDAPGKAPVKTPWHTDTKSMIITDELADRLLQEAPLKTWLTVPPELAKHLATIIT
jgi:hypothetical protein